MEKLTIDVQLAQATLLYLQKRPYEEVFQLIAGFTQLKKVGDPDTPYNVRTVELQAKPDKEVTQ